jgi:murein endopeptidase
LKDSEDCTEDQLEWVSVQEQTVLPSLWASDVALLIMTSADMPKIVFCEDLIEQSAKLTSNQLVNVVYRNTTWLKRVKCKSLLLFHLEKYTLLTARNS